jgi:hypothetical protein
MMRSKISGFTDINTAYFDNICVFLGETSAVSDANEPDIPDGQDFRHFNVTLQGDNVISDIYFYGDLTLAEFFYYYDTDNDEGAEFNIKCTPVEFIIYKEVGPGHHIDLIYKGVPSVNGNHYHLEFPLSALGRDRHHEFRIQYWFFALASRDRMPDSGKEVLVLIL